MEKFGDYSKYYDLLYKDKDYNKEVEYIEWLIHKYNPNTKYILDLGCGTGKHDILLAKKYNIVWVDISIDMINLAKKNTSNIEFILWDITEVKLNKKFDTIVSLFDVINYINENEKIIDTFKNVSEHLMDWWIFIFDCRYWPWVLTERPINKIKKMENDEIKVFRNTGIEMFSNENIVDVNFDIFIFNKENKTIFKTKEKHRMRYLFLPEIKLFLDIAWLELIEAKEFITWKEPWYNTWKLCCVSRKIQ